MLPRFVYYTEPKKMDHLESLYMVTEHLNQEQLTAEMNFAEGFS